MMTLELAKEVDMSTHVELLLADLLDREWEAQSGRMAPLAWTPVVRELLELVLAETPWGAFAALALTESSALTPDEVVAELRDVLPAELSPWRLRAVRRAGALRGPQPVLPAGDTPPVLAVPERDALPMPPPEEPPAPEAQALLVSVPEAEALFTAEAEALFMPTPELEALPEPETEPEAETDPDPEPVRKRAPRAGFILIAAAACTLLGAGIRVAGAELHWPDFTLGAIAGFAAAAVAVFAGGRR